MRLILANTLMLALFTGCRSEQALVALTDQAASQTPPAVTPVTPAEPPATQVQTPSWRPVDHTLGSGAAVRVLEDPQLGLRAETFQWGGDTATPVADYLFVIDNSVSMENIIDRVRQAMATLSRSSAFPAKARIAVLNTTPVDPADTTQPHPAARWTHSLALEPGFGRLVNGDDILSYRTQAPRNLSRRFHLDGCSSWFSPADTNSVGQPCLVAHTQTARTPLHVEAGLVSFGQLLSHAQQPLFRDGAAVNVIFVSDTHDPGVPKGAPGHAELMALQPDADTLRELVEANSMVSSFRVHAIAPASSCVEAFNTDSYRQVAQATGGQFLDVCTATDYRSFVRQMAKKGAVPTQPVLPLGKPATDVEQVRVDGERVGFSVNPTGQVLLLDKAPDQRSRVSVRYRYGEPTPQRPDRLAPTTP